MRDAVRGRWPLAAAAATAGGPLLTGRVEPLIVLTPLVAYALGAHARLVSGLAGVALMVVCLQAVAGPFNPLFEMITIGPWAAGRIVPPRRRLAQQIEARNRELEAQRALFALESVRYERARIARELHDIVAHCVTVIVVQAGAGRRLAGADPERAAEALDAIADAAREAETEIALLTRHLDGAATARARGLQMIEELAYRTAATGLAVRLSPSGDLRKLGPPASDAAYRVVQESLTNAIKHAPGAPIEITLREADDELEVEVTSAASRHAASGLEHTGGGRGLVGMGERAAACGGTLAAGPTATGGWRVTARLPC